MAHDVFISYYHDDKAVADAACAKLEQQGVRCWIAPRDVVPGDPWPQSIVRAINDARVMVLVFSSKANESPQINKEVERAVHKGLIVVPVRIEDVLPVESFEFFFGNVHWLDAITPPIQNHLDHLADTVKLLLERTEPHNAAQSAAPVQRTDYKRGPVAEIAASPASPSLQSRPEDLSGGSSAGVKKPAVRRMSLRAVLGVAAASIVLLAIIHFAMKHRKQTPAIGQTATGSEPNASGQLSAPISSPSSLPSTGISSSPNQSTQPMAVNQIGAGPGPNDGEHWNALGSGTRARLISIFGTSDGTRLWAVGDKGTILESDDGEHWIARNSGTSEHLDWIFGTSNGNRLWAVGENGTILESDDGAHWVARDSGSPNRLYSIFGTSDGKRLWAVGDKGTILESGDGEHWIERDSGTSNLLETIIGTSDGNRLWALGDKGTILESDGGKN
jgi:hypothetical protein